jgi:hypothetical protein
LNFGPFFATVSSYPWHLLSVVVDLDAETLGEHVLEHQVVLFAGSAFGNLGRDIKARLVHPVRSYQLLGAKIEGDPDDVAEGHVLAVQTPGVLVPGPLREPTATASGGESLIETTSNAGA